ncbi:unnamed protein product, partial [Mesorhabditis belari]|uniref:Uncharacterized protein n=1 Tax=Mesorhabditis belari TaxID=2138241 RepID=A0AAF3FB55_9BILA
MLSHVLLIIATVIGSVWGQSKCDDGLYSTCQTTLNDALQINNTQPWRNPALWRDDVEQYFRSGFDGTRVVCKAFREFKNCLGGNYTVCTSAAHYIQAGAAEVDNAYIFSSIFNEMHYVCGAGLQVAALNDACFQATWQNFGSTIRSCRQAWESIVKVTPGDACFQANNMLGCNEDYFGRQCGKTNQAAMFWGCEYARVQVFTRFPQCLISCSLPIAGGGVGK